MRSLWKDVLAAVWLGMILPGILLNAFALQEGRFPSQKPAPRQVEALERTGQYIQLQDSQGCLTEMELDTYLTGVLLAEMPAEFHLEALKAQAVAARTFTWKAHTTGGKHGNGSVCTDSACCQAYLTEEDYGAKGGSEEAVEKVRRAVEATSGLVLTFGGELIEATYFSSTAGSTEAAVAVWGGEFPYLQAVSSPEEPDTQTVTFTLPQFCQLLGRQLPQDPMEWFGRVSYTPGGGVAEMEIAGETYTGVELRSLLGLRSTAFQIQADGETVAVTTKGYGHRVGMSQYGAQTMAENGSNYQKILQHYYPGVNLVPIT